MSTIEALVQHMQFQWQRHEVLANNLANTATPGFKRDVVALVPESVGATTNAANVLPLPSGLAMIQWTDFTQGFLQPTGRTLDAALNGPGFFVVDGGPAGPRYTRAGNFNVNKDGVLVGANGSPVLGRNGTITLTSSKVNIGATGEVFDNGRLVDTLRVVDFPRPYRFNKEGQGLLTPVDATVEPTPAQNFEVTGGALEASNVGTVPTMVGMIDVLRTYEACQRAMQAVEEANQHATSDIGKVS
jgi:flagellar basal-body rod protein FlgG